MDRVFFDKWLTALRSGEYQQGKNALKRIDQNGNVQYCCLGVACDLINPKWADSPDNYQQEANSQYGFYGWFADTLMESSYGSSEVIDLPFLSDLRYDVGKQVADMNDNGATFLEIADWLEENVNPDLNKNDV